jgi:alginate O-acetyltransferase complex protein AlgI
MPLYSLAWFVFLAVCLLLYWPLSRWRNAALAALWAGNCFYLAHASLTCLWLLPLASAIDYLAGRGIASSSHPRQRRLWLGLSLFVNLGLLFVSRYAALLFQTLEETLHQPMPHWNLALSLSLSFYVFQSLTWTIDLYRKDAKPATSLLAHVTASSFFCTISAGPITRIAKLLPQLEKRAPLTAALAGEALFRIALGIVKKRMIADYLSENFINRVFDFPALYSGLEALLAVYAYALQLYFDFSGYSDIAIGSALLFGIRLPENFNVPYLAVNIAEFWRRWHISLSNWLRDYLYFSFPGLRRSVMPSVALIATMVLGGLWHGASWNFALWGLLHGVGLAAFRFFEQWNGREQKRWPIPDWLAICFTFHFVCFAWIFFRAASFEQALAILDRIRSFTLTSANLNTALWMLIVIGVVGHVLPMRWLKQCSDWFTAAPAWAQAAMLALLVFGLHYSNATGAAPFIYTRF